MSDSNFENELCTNTESSSPSTALMTVCQEKLDKLETSYIDSHGRHQWLYENVSNKNLPPPGEMIHFSPVEFKKKFQELFSVVHLAKMAHSADLETQAHRLEMLHFMLAEYGLHIYMYHTECEHLDYTNKVISTEVGVFRAVLAKILPTDCQSGVFSCDRSQLSFEFGNIIENMWDVRSSVSRKTLREFMLEPHVLRGLYYLVKVVTQSHPTVYQTFICSRNFLLQDSDEAYRIKSRFLEQELEQLETPDSQEMVIAYCKIFMKCSRSTTFDSNFYPSLQYRDSHHDSTGSDYTDGNSDHDNTPYQSQRYNSQRSINRVWNFSRTFGRYPNRKNYNSYNSKYRPYRGGNYQNKQYRRGRRGNGW